MRQLHKGSPGYAKTAYHRPHLWRERMARGHLYRNCIKYAVYAIFAQNHLFMSLHTRIIETLSRQIPPENSLVKWLSQQLDIDYSAAHRKMTGKSQLKLTELEQLCRVQPELATLLPTADQGQMVVEQSSFQSYEGLSRYLSQVEKQLEQALAQGMELRYFARDFPFFFFLSEPRLAAYKFAMWTHQLPEEGLKPLDANLENQCQAIAELYRRLPSFEIWYNQALKNQIDQLSWHFDLGFISREAYYELLEAFRSALQPYEQWAASGQKNSDTPYKLYSTGFCTLNNGGLFQNGSQSKLLQAVMSVFFIATQAEEMVTVFQREFDAHLQQSLNLHNQKNAQQFFGAQEQALQDAGKIG